MTTAPKRELRDLIAQTLVFQPIFTLLVDENEPRDVRFMSEVDAATIADAIVKEWKVSRNRRWIKDDHGYVDGGDVQRNVEGEPIPGSFLEIETKWRPDTDEERRVDEERRAALMWALDSHPGYGDESDELVQAYHSPGPAPDGFSNPEPPPQRVRLANLLEQRAWWMKRGVETVDDAGNQTWYREPILIDDMDHKHRLNTLAWLARRAHELKMRHEWSTVALMSGPLGPRGDMAQDACDRELDDLMSESVESWFERQPLVLELRYRTTPWGASPATWRPMSEVPRHRRFQTFGQEIVVRYRVEIGGVEVDSSGESSTYRVVEAIVHRSAPDDEWVITPGEKPLPRNFDGSEVELVEWRELTREERSRLAGWMPLREASTDGTVIVVRPNPEESGFLAVWHWVGGDVDHAWCYHPRGGVIDATLLENAEWSDKVHWYCEHEGYEEVDCETCGYKFYSCPHGGTRGAEYCFACEQE